MPDRLYFTDSDEANVLLATDRMALLIGFALDPHRWVPSGPALAKELGSR